IRFRDLDSLYSAFTPWFIPNGINSNTSFPSGHSAMAWMILPLLMLVPVSNKKLRSVLIVIIILWGLIVGLSRIVIGAHYASDVLFGGCIVIFIFLGICNRSGFK
ncbi:MAG: phosphatase PAP2 family protein, partial [Ignavibacteriaceae bacterium]